MPWGTEYSDWGRAQGKQISRLSNLLNNTPSIVANAGLSGDTVIFVMFSQRKKGFIPRAETLSGRVTEVRPKQKENAWSPMEVTLSGRVMEVRLE